MDTLLIFFILPLATIIIAAILESVLNNPVAVAAFVFALAIVIVFLAFTPAELIYAIIYTVLAYIVAVIVCLIRRFCNRNQEDEDDENDSSACDCLRNNSVNNSNSFGNTSNQINYTYTTRGRRML